MTKRANSSHAAGKSATKPLAILVIGLIAAVAVAIFLSRSAPESATGLGLEATTPDGTAPTRIRGPEGAIVTLLEFGDYQCPTCAFFHPLVVQLMERFPSELQFEFHHFPLITIHANAIYASVAAEAAAEQNAFWEMHDLLFENQNDWANHPNPQQLFMTYAGQLGLNPTAFEAALASDRILERITQDLNRAQELRLTGTPSFFVNGQPIPLPRSYAEFESYIVTAIQSAG